MKKKLAFFLAVIMVVSSFSGMTLGASSTNRITRMITDTESNTLWFEEGMGVGEGEFTRRHTNEPIKYWREGASLHIELNHNVSAGTQFAVDLEGAAWYFRQGGERFEYAPGEPFWLFWPFPSSITDVAGAMEFSVTIPAGEFDPNDFLIGGIGEFPENITIPIPAAVVTNHDYFTTRLGHHYLEVPPVPDENPEHSLTLICPNVKSDTVNTWVNENLINWLEYPIWSWSDGLSVGDDLILTAIVPQEARNAEITVYVTTLMWRSATDIIAEYRPIVDEAPSFPAVGVLRFPFREIRERADDWTPENLNYVMPANTFNFVPRVFCVDTQQVVGGRFLEFTDHDVTTFFNFEDGVPYRLDIVGPAFQNRAVVTILEDVTPTVSDDSTIKIPLVLRTTRDDDIRVRVTSGFHQISNTTHMIGQNIDYRVNVRFEGVTIQPHQIDIARLILTEQMAGAMPAVRSWGIEIWAPDGYLWDSSYIPYVFPLPPLAWADGTTDIKCFNETGMTAGHRLINDELDKSSLIIYMNEGVIRPSTTGHGGELRFTHLRLVPINPNNAQDGRSLYATVRNFGGSVVREGDMFIGVERVHQNNNNQNNNNQGGGSPPGSGVSTPDNDNN